MLKNISILLLFISTASFAQDPSVRMPDLDTDKNPFTLKFSEDPEDNRILSSYISGTTERDSLFFKAKAAPSVEKVMVTLLLKNKSEEVNIDIVKKNWNDVKRTGKTKNGWFQISFDTADEFGIILSSQQKGVDFDMAIWRGGKVKIPTAKKLFYAVGLSSNDKASIVNAEKEESPINVSTETSSFSYVIIGILAIIVILLLLLLLKNKKSQTMSLLMLFFLSQNLLFAQVKESSSKEFIKKKQQYQDPALENIRDFVHNVGELVTGGGDYDFLSEDDENDISQDFFTGQPTLPSSCLNTYNNRESGNTSDPNNNERNVESEHNKNEKHSKGNNKNELTNKPIESNTNINEKPDRGPGESSNSTKEYQLPIYDRNGDLKDYGDFPNAPKKINPINNNPNENPFIEGDVSEGQTLRQPKYDDDGGLIDYGDFPDAPLIIDVENGIPPMHPFIEGSEQEGKFIRQPKYDKNGDLINSGDFPDAPSYIKPSTIESNDNPFTGEVSDQRIDTDTYSKDKDSLDKEDGRPDSSTKDNLINESSSERSNDSDRENNQEEDTQNEGCECLKKAYQKLDHRRFNLESLRIISSRIKRKTKRAIAFGDNVAGIHAVSGLVWQSEKKGIIASLKKFDRTYDRKYNEMMNDLHSILLDIDKCEDLLGFENWYEGYGNIYFTFMQDKYNRN